MSVAFRIKDGQVVESGSHEELIKQGSDGKSSFRYLFRWKGNTDNIRYLGVYYEMWQKQLHDDEESGASGEAKLENGKSDLQTKQEETIPAIKLPEEPHAGPTAPIAPIDTIRAVPNEEESKPIVSSPTEMESSSKPAEQGAQEDEQQEQQQQEEEQQNLEDSNNADAARSNTGSSAKSSSNKRKKKKSKSKRKSTVF